jgi:poly(A) polymerase
VESSALRIVRRLRAAGHEALYAGGCVRDALMGKKPHDFDIATSARPEQVQALFPRTVLVGAQFGVILVIEDGSEYQVATFRSDGIYKDGRHPQSVTFGSAQGDAQRRDFTVNGLFYDPIEKRVLDFVGGRKDLETRTLRAIGDPSARFAEDKLRLLRAVRFASVLDFEIEDATWSAVREGASAIHEVSAERIRDELVKIFESSGRVRGFDLLDASGLMLQSCRKFHP